MKNQILLVCMALLSLFGLKAQIPTTSTAGNDVYYFIKGTRGSTATALWVTAAANNSQVLNKELIASDAQRWKVVVSGDGLALVNKAYGTYLNTDLEDYIILNTVVAPPTTKLDIVLADAAHDLMVYDWVPGAVHVQNHGAENISWDAWADLSPASNTFLMHAGGSKDFWGLVNYFDDYSDNASFLFLSETPELRKQALQELITEATAGVVANVADNAVVVSAKAAVQLDLTAAQTANNNAGSTYEELGVASDNLNHSFDKLKTIKALADKIASVTTVHSTSAEGFNPGQFTAEAREGLQTAIAAAQVTLEDPSATNEDWLNSMNDLDQIVMGFKALVILPVISTEGNETWYYIQGTRPLNTYMASQGVDAALKSTAVVNGGTDDQLWKLVANGTGFSLVNKTTGQYVNTDVVSNTALSTQAGAPANGLKFITSPTTTNNTYRFWIENTDATTPKFRLHAGNTNVMNWTGDKNDNCTWLFLDQASLFKSLYMDAVKKARAIYNSTTEGDNFGQYSSAKRITFNGVITAAETVDLSTKTNAELTTGADALVTATADYSCNNDITLLQTATPASSVKWFRLINNATAVYANGKAMSSNGRDENMKFTFETKDINSDAQLFRFELDIDNTGVVNIINKANGFFLGSDGTVLSTSTPGILFAITALDGQSFWIKPGSLAPIHAAQSGTSLLNWDSGAGSASAWVFEFVKEEAISALKNTSATNFVVRTKQGIVTIDGVDNFDVYSVLGQKQNRTKALKSGVYFIKVKNATQKFVIK